jgi:hypothetical protein
MLERALQQPFGEERDAQVAVWERINDVSETLYLDEPGRAVNDALDRDGAPIEDPLERVVLRSAVAPSNGDVDAPFVLHPVSEQSERPDIRTPSAAQPLRLWVAGDSMAGIFGLALVRRANDTGVVTAELDYRLSTGLSRPDYFNWPAHFMQETAKRKPEVVVAVFGANDSQGLQTPAGDVYQPMSDGWRAEYARRVGGTMDLLHSPGRMVLWIGQPIARDGDYSARMQDMNRIYEEQAATRPWVVFVDTFPFFADKDGNYNAYLPNGDGDIEKVREQDGVHLTWAGGDKMASVVMYYLGQFVKLSPDGPAEAMSAP